MITTSKSIVDLLPEGWVALDYDPTPTYRESAEILDIACMALYKMHPAYGELLLAIEVNLEWSPPKEDGTPGMTLGVDKDCHLVVNPWFFNPIDLYAQVGILMHELDHLLLEHPQEMELYDNHPKCNVAMDLCVNSNIKEIPIMRYSKDELEKIQKGEELSLETRKEFMNPKRPHGLHPNYFGFNVGLPAADYYDLLPKKEEDLENMINAMGAFIPQHHWGMDPGAAQRLQQTIDSVVDQMEQRGRGTLPGNFYKRLEKARVRTKTPWNMLLRQYARQYLQGERGLQYKRPDRRTDMIPGRHRLKKHRCYIAVDTSGSTMGDREAFASEMEAIHRQTKAEMFVIECDAMVQKDPYKFKGKLPTEHSWGGNGGTAFSPVFEYIRDKNITVSLLVYLTDGYGENPPKPPYVKYPVIWVTTQVPPCNWGRIIKMEREDSSDA